ncbi:MAG TPA: DUF6308 family protein [Candidatus Latescibacteria bacterium]|nr:DUF6308 family protein [Candidatus Latescibacterota bacterium]HQE61680.1 DUF6308 family protein [Candidatus Latescibacterota bacterium]HQI76481.1 DUF6308 family protein [Candidatus Latescibacterota bacterium]HRU22891.1 DUF6308 family protein [Candidatus Latescibacterota bacterium]
MNDSLTLSPFARKINGCAAKLRCFRENAGYAYLAYQPITPWDRLVPEDLAVTLAFNSNAGWRAFASLVAHAYEVDLSKLPEKALHETTPDERERIIELISEIVKWPGFATSLATKVLHKKRPHLIPVLDNRAIFESYLDHRWPERRTVGDTVKDATKVRHALDALVADLNAPENAGTWQALSAVDPGLTRIEALDMVWWMHFRDLEPVKAP